jgi:hypothetical protein
LSISWRSTYQGRTPRFRLLTYQRGIPAHDWLNDVVNGLDAALLKTCFSTYRLGGRQRLVLARKAAADKSNDIAKSSGRAAY